MVSYSLQFKFRDSIKLKNHRLAQLVYMDQFEKWQASLKTTKTRALILPAILDEDNIGQSVALKIKFQRKAHETKFEFCLVDTSHKCVKFILDKQNMREI